MRKGLVSDGPRGKHPNAGSGVRVSAAGAPVTAGEHIKRTHEHNHGVQVLDSPPYVEPPKNYCSAIRTDGKPCKNEVAKETTIYCFGHRAGRGAYRG